MQSYFTFGTNNFPYVGLNTDANIQQTNASTLVPSARPLFLPEPPVTVVDEEDALMTDNEDDDSYPACLAALFTTNGPVSIDEALESIEHEQQAPMTIVEGLVRYDSILKKQMVDIEYDQLQALLEAVRRREGWSWLLNILLHIQTRMVHGDVTRRAKQFKLGIVKKEFINDWFQRMSPDSVRTTYRNRRTREAGGNNLKDEYINVRFTGENVGNVPIVPKGWNKFYFEQKFFDGRSSLWYFFSLDDVLFSYNCFTSMLEASFSYTVKNVQLVGGRYQWTNC